ncbi:MAG: pyridoxamine 5'-phosphate oxidase family protein [Pseudomonadota bacterium]
MPTSLTEEMKTLLQAYNAASVATVNDDGTPAVSPKATFVIVDDNTIAFGDIRSPNTIKNLKARPATELNFIDVLTRRALRVTGTAKIIEKNSAAATPLLPLFEELWAPYLDVMRHFVLVNISRTQLILSPAYDTGASEDDLRDTNLKKLSSI